MVIAFVGTPAVMGEGSTALCRNDELTCAAGGLVTHLHMTSVGKVKLESSLPTIECNALFLGDVLNSGLANPLVFHGAFTFSSCNNFCTVREESPGALILYLRLGTHLADVTYHYLVNKLCPFINCNYIVEVEGHSLDPLIAEEKNGSEVFAEQEVEKESGSCPETHLMIGVFTSLVPIYISS
jgi:hypothetical protein